MLIIETGNAEMFTFTLFKKSYSVATLAEAAALFNVARDKSGKGSRTMPLPEISKNGVVVYHFSYNGKIWDGPSSQWIPGSEPVYSPYVDAA